MSHDPTNHDRAPVAEEEETADLPQAPPGAPEGHDGVPEPDGQVADAESREPSQEPSIAELTAKAEEYLALAQRKQAEFENFRRRTARDAAMAAERGATKLAKELLPAVDNLERALEHAPEETDEHGFVAGVRHVHSDLIAALQRAGIEQYSPQGEVFDPTLHEAVAQQPSEGAAPGTVVEVFQRGYRVGETVVRPARVVVAG